MPQTETGKTLLTKFVQEYGAKKGKSVFYGKVNSNRKFAKATGEMSVRRRAGKD